MLFRSAKSCAKIRPKSEKDDLRNEMVRDGAGSAAEAVVLETSEHCRIRKVSCTLSPGGPGSADPNAPCGASTADPGIWLLGDLWIDIRIS